MPATERSRPPGRRRQRAAWGSISREQVVSAAMRAVRAGRYDQMTIRSLAADLGVAPMSLYRHVRDKNDLLDEVVDRLLARVWRPRAPERPWRPWVSEAADRLRRFLVAQPAALHVYLHHPVVSPAAVDRMKAILHVLGEAGFEEEAARRAYAAVHTYTVGFAALEASRAGWTPPVGEIDDLTHRLAAYTAPSQFAMGLDFLLEGLAGRPDKGVGEAPPAKKR